jgi:hypothetical protein
MRARQHKHDAHGNYQGQKNVRDGYHFESDSLLPFRASIVNGCVPERSFSVSLASGDGDEALISWGHLMRSIGDLGRVISNLTRHARSRILP